jgi:hypothetical protein
MPCLHKKLQKEEYFTLPPFEGKIPVREESQGLAGL